MARTARPAPSSSRAVPPVDTISIPSSASPRANSTSPRLSDTVSSARRIRTSPGSTTSRASESVVAMRSHLLNDHVPRRLGIDPHGPGRKQPHRARQQPVLDLVDAFLDGGDVPRIRRINRERLLQDDRPRVDPLVDEVHAHPRLLHAVLDRLLDRTHARERWEERRVHVDDPPGEAADERRAEQLQEAGEHERVDTALLEPVAERLVARRPVGIRARLEHARLDPDRLRPLEPARRRSVRPDRHHLYAVAAVRLVEDRLEVRALARDEYGYAQAHAATGAGGASRTGYGPPVVWRRFSSISSSIRARMSARRMFAEVPYAGRPS